MRERLPGRGHLAYGDEAQRIRGRLDQFREQRRVALAVVADERPVQVRQIADEPAQLRPLVLDAGTHLDVWDRDGQEPASPVHLPRHRSATAAAA